MRWHPKAASLVKYAYQIFYGSINTNNPSFNPELQRVLQLSERCLVCHLSNKEWKHPKGIIAAGNQGGCCSAKVADTLVPQATPNIVNHVETFTITTESIKFLRKNSQAIMPKKGTTGSAAYDLYPTQEETILPCSRKLIPTGLSCEFPSHLYGQITSRSGMSAKHSVDVVTGVLDSDYRGPIGVLLHNHSDQPYQVKLTQAMAQILFLPLSQLPVKEVTDLSETTRGAKGFRSTDVKTFSSEVIQLKPVAGRPPGTTFMGAQPSKALVRLNSVDGPIASIVVDSGSNISLVSSKLLDKLNPTPKA